MLRRIVCICLASLFAAGQTGPSFVTLPGPGFKAETANALRIDPAIAQRMVADQQQEDHVIGIWTAQAGTYRCRFAVVKNPNHLNDAFDFVGVLLEPWPGFESGEAALFISRTVDANAYTGKEKWKDAQSFSKSWYPAQLVVTSDTQGVQNNTVDFATPLGKEWVLTRTSAPQPFQPNIQPTVSQSAARPPTATVSSIGPFVLEDGTPVKLRTARTISSAEAHVGDTLDLEVLDEVKVGDVVVIPQGGIAWATVTEAEPKKRMGRGGKLNVNIDTVKLASGARAPLRAVQGGNGGGHVGAMTGAIVATAIVFWPAAPFFLFMHGKDITVPKGTAFTAYVSGNVPLDKASFLPKTAAIAAVPTAAATTETVSITSLPPNADIEVDGSFVGSTPSSVTLEPGEHTITVTHKGFNKWERKIKASSGAVNLNVELEAQPAH
jgi:uncharacterized cupin superfamily protein